VAKRTVSFSDYKEPTWEEYTGEDPPPNKWFTGRVNRARYDKDDDQVVFIVEITEGDYKGWGRGWYAPFEGNLKWKMHEILRALQGGKTTDVSLDWENDTAVANFLKKCKAIRFRTEEYNDRISIRKVSPLLTAVPGGTDAPKVAPEPELDDPEDGGDEPYTEEELSDMGVGELEEILVEEFEVPKGDLPAKPRRDPKGEKYKAALIEEILAEQEGDEGSEDGEADEEEPEGEGDEFDTGFDEDEADDEEGEPEPEPEPEPAPRARRSRAAKAAPAPAKAASTTTRRRRG